MEDAREHIRLEMESRSDNEEFARVGAGGIFYQVVRLNRSDKEGFARGVPAVFMSRLDPTIEETDDVKTAVSEAVTNAVIHGYKEGEGTVWMELTADRKDRCLTVRITDQGVGIQDIEKAMEPMYTTDRSGERSGMGFSFMEAFMDQVEVKSEPGRGTAVTMKKYIGR